MERGFKYDRLTEADDATIAATRGRIYACPCGAGSWVSIQTGEVYSGNGGNEREQWWLQSRGPWVLIAKDDRLNEETKRANAAYRLLEDLKDSIAELIGAEQ